jgi:hypothetical protein
MGQVAMSLITTDRSRDCPRATARANHFHLFLHPLASVLLLAACLPGPCSCSSSSLFMLRSSSSSLGLENVKGEAKLVS